LICAIAIGLLLFSDEKQSQGDYSTSEVRRSDLTIQVTVTGTLEPLNQVAVGSEISGTMAEVLVDFNEWVKCGQVLARLNTDEQQAKAMVLKTGLKFKLFT